MSSTSMQERTEFTERLIDRLKSIGIVRPGPTEVARNFNVRWAGEPITVHAARKWLVAEAVPTQDKIKVLAEWLDVSPEWLRFGGDSSVPAPKPDGLSKEDVRLLSDFHVLDDHHRNLAHEVIRAMIRQKNKDLTEA